MRSRAATLYAMELRRSFFRPLTWVLLLLVAVVAWGLTTGDLRISSGDNTVGGAKAWVTSEFANAQVLSMVIFLFYSFFVAVAAGLAVIQDDELKVGEVLHATPLRPAEYVWAKFLAVLSVFGIVLVAHLALAAFFNHIVPSAHAEEIRGPFSLLNYLRPALVFGLPPVLFVAGTAFAVGEAGRRPILVFGLPVAAVLACAFFLWEWSPGWLDPRINRLLMWLDPAGVRWLSETWLSVDRGTAFYNTEAIAYDAPFLLSRIAFAAIGVLAVAGSAARVSRMLRGGSTGGRRIELRRRASEFDRTAAVVSGIASGETQSPGVSGIAPGETQSPGASGIAPGETRSPGVSGVAPGETRAPVVSTVVPGEPAVLVASTAPRGDTTVRLRAPGFLDTLRDTIRFEIREVRAQAGLYLFVPLILLQTLGSCLLVDGPFSTRILVTSGSVAAASMNTLTLLGCLLLLFYSVESLRRERNTGISPLFFSTPSRTAPILFGKAIANLAVVKVILLATMLVAAIVILVQGRTGFDPRPFLLVWGLLLIPTFLVWTGFVMALFSITRNRYACYALGLAALAVTGWLQMRGTMSWASNWNLWGAVRWSDLSVLELDRAALILNRLAAVSLAVFFFALAVKLFPRRDADASRLVHRLAPASLARAAVRLLPLAVVPIVLITVLAVRVHGGEGGGWAKARALDYWKENLATWKDARQPDIAHADLLVELDPDRSALRSEGSFRLVNATGEPMRRFALTGGLHWTDIAWSLDGAPYEPEDRSRLFVFTPASILQPGDSVTVGFRFHGRHPSGISKNGGGAREFVLPSGVVLTSFTPSFVPVVGYQPEVGLEDENRYNPKEWSEGFQAGLTPPAIGTRRPFTLRMEVRGPSRLVYNGVGVKTRDEVDDGRRTVVWETDRPVRFFNLVAGAYETHSGEGVTIYYDRAHTHNIEEMTRALEGSRRWYSEWFHPFPWRELKVSEFPALASYAQGFPTNITFSEGIGFLTKSDARSKAAFLITAHEAAHQWWGNLLTPGGAPGGPILAEGMAHFSTILLAEEVEGARTRIEFCRRIEERYGDLRRVDAERPLVWVDGEKQGDETLLYDKGGWVFWMLLNEIGREATFAGLQSFIAQYKDGPDFPVLFDFIESMRPFAPDAASCDAFVEQWFLGVVVPEYRLSDAVVEAIGGSVEDGGEATGETALDGGGEATLDTALDGERWRTRVVVRNIGTGRVPVEVAAVLGERFLDDGSVSPDYREVRREVDLEAGEAAAVELESAFRPDRVDVDPDARVLQLRREAAPVRL